MGKQRLDNLTYAYVSKHLSYDPETGIFRWKFTRRTKKFNVLVHEKGTTPEVFKGGNPKSYRLIKLNGKYYKENRLAVLLMKKRWPLYDVDHKNQKKYDNRWVNLRECSESQNHANTGLQSNNTSGHKGVSWSKQSGKWMAYIKVKDQGIGKTDGKGQRIHLGFFVDKKDAARAYNAAALKYFGDFANLNVVSVTLPKSIKEYWRTL